MKFLYVVIGAVLASIVWFAFGEMKEETESEKFAKVIFTGLVTESSVNDLISTIDEINQQYGDLEKIYLYIRSWGGNADAGDAAYWIIRSSRTPITTVNLAYVGSAASVMFCGGRERLSLEYGTFLLHPPALMVQEAPWTVDELRQMDEMINISAKFSTEAYKTCTSMPEEEIRAISYSENQRLVLTAEQAREKGLISGTVDGVIDTSISYVVSD